MLVQVARAECGCKEEPGDFFIMHWIWMSFVVPPPLQQIQQCKQVIYACVEKRQDVKQTLDLFRHRR